MSNCIKELYDYEFFKKCSMCGILYLKTYFHKGNKRKDGVQTICTICIKEYQNNRKEQRNALERQKRKTIEVEKIEISYKSFQTFYPI